MKTRVGLVLVVLAILGLGASAASTAEHEDGVFIHVSHGTNHPHRLLMALNMAVIMSEDHDVLVYFDIDGIDAVLEDSQDVSYSHFPTSKTQLQELRKRGVTVMACPGCLKAAGRTPDDLADGVEVADKATFFSFTKGRILTLEY